jgi:hypothetical protein
MVNVYRGRGHILQAAPVTRSESHPPSLGDDTSSPMPLQNYQQKKSHHKSHFLIVIHYVVFIKNRVVPKINTLLGSVLTTILEA